MQHELQRVGCNPGSLDGKWGDKGKAALGRFIKYAKVSVTADVPTADALDIMSAQRVRICPLECEEGERAVGDKCVAKPRDVPSEPVSRPSHSSASAPRDLNGYSLNFWPRNSLRQGQSVSTNTPFGSLTCTSVGRNTPRDCSLR